MRRTLVLSAVLVLVGLPAGGQQTPPSCSATQHRQFDFWLGSWTVTDSAGTTTLGSNNITREESGCLVHEHWTDADGSTGQSFNFYDPTTSRWAQVWVSSSGNVLRLEGRLDGPSMRLEGDQHPRTGVTVRHRITWTPQPDGRVRQTWSASKDGGRTWKRVFDGWYRK
jgi:hypothetical protein